MARLTTVRTGGDADFFAALRGFVAMHRHGVVTTAEFEKALAAVVGVAQGARLVKEVLNPWLRELPLPPLPA